MESWQKIRMGLFQFSFTSLDCVEISVIASVGFTNSRLDFQTALAGYYCFNVVPHPLVELVYATAIKDFECLTELINFQVISFSFLIDFKKLIDFTMLFIVISFNDLLPFLLTFVLVIILIVLPLIKKFKFEN